MTDSVISLGAGVQSSTMLLMAAHGELDDFERPELAVFADTGWEPGAVYEWLGFLRIEAYRFGIEIATATKGNLRESMLTPRTSAKSGNTYMKPSAPFFVAGESGRREAKLPRHCTSDYKIEPVQRELRRRGFGDARPVRQFMGISLDESLRMKPSRVDWIENVYPLVDLGMTRQDCFAWMAAKGYPEPPRSACVGCPFHSDDEWRRLRDGDPEGFADAVQFERDLQAVDFTALRGTPFLHRDLVPLDQVDLSTPRDRGQGNLFDDECEGMCGV